MTIMRNQIRCFIAENGAIVIVTENDCDSVTFQCRCAQEWFSNAHNIKRDLYQNSSATVCRHVTIDSFRFEVWQCHVVCCHCRDV